LKILGIAQPSFDFSRVFQVAERKKFQVLSNTVCFSDLEKLNLILQFFNKLKRKINSSVTYKNIEIVQK
jgi:hypothetical protein